MAVFWSADIIDEVAKLVAQRGQDLIFILDRFCGAAVRKTGANVKKNAPSKKGISSSRVRSGPRAKAMVERRWMAFSRRRTSSCWSNISVQEPEIPCGIYL
jgi:hypothetical protein